MSSHVLCFPRRENPYKKNPNEEKASWKQSTTVLPSPPQEVVADLFKEKLPTPPLEVV